MNQTNVLMRIVEMAKVGGALSPEEAMSTVSAMIGRLDVHSASYEPDIDALVKIGATIWTLASRPGESSAPL
ncbi:MAG: hypothetical protein EON54_06445 [Alcaligenaceae bacterium]|nr:MAG: hypothetical protein EON54_06445 [Alcaligenaceae bacterium]